MFSLDYEHCTVYKLMTYTQSCIHTYSTDQGPSLADAFEYVMYGKVYRIEGGEGPGDSGRL